MWWDSRSENVLPGGRPILKRDYRGGSCVLARADPGPKSSGTWGEERILTKVWLTCMCSNWSVGTTGNYLWGKQNWALTSFLLVLSAIQETVSSQCSRDHQTKPDQTSPRSLSSLTWHLNNTTLTLRAQQNQNSWNSISRGATFTTRSSIRSKGSINKEYPVQGPNLDTHRTDKLRQIGISLFSITSSAFLTL